MKTQQLFSIILILMTSQLYSQILYDEMPDVAEYILEGRKWDKTNLTYFFENGTTDISNTEERDIVRQAFQVWANVSSLSFTEVTSASTADIVVEWGTGDHCISNNFDGSGGVLAHAFYPPPNGGDLAGDCHFDDDETWTSLERNNSGQPIDLLTVAIHEIGHSIGIAHSDIPSAIMYAYYGGSRRTLDNDDVAAVQALYPPDNLDTWRFSAGTTESWKKLAKSSAAIKNIRLGDFDGNGKTDVFATFGGRWHVSYDGVSNWQHLARSNTRIENLRFGDFDGNGKTDVFISHNGQWKVSYDGLGNWENLATSNVSINNLRFGDFDGDGKTDVFTSIDGQWKISSGGTGNWKDLATSNISLNNLRFGDFDGDGKTDVFTTSKGQWKFSSSGTASWKDLATSSAKIYNLVIGDFDGDGKDDVFTTSSGQWKISSAAISSWQETATSSVKISNLLVGDFDGDGKDDVFTSY